METNHACLIIKPRPTDYILGVNSPIPLKANLPSGNWQPYIEFFEPQSENGWDTDGCVLFSSQESFDAQIERMIQAGEIPAATLALFNQLGYMDSANATDGKPHFHTSPRFLQVLTGNGFNGNSVPEAFDVMRTYGCLPWTDLPYDSTITQAEYLAPIPPPILDKAAQFLAAIGGKNAIQYHWVANGTENMDAMKAALPTAPLCFGVNVGDNWNVAAPPAPPVGSAPGHCVMNYTIDSDSDSWIYDHYLPNPKELTPTYPIQYALQGIVTVTPPPPAPTLPPHPTVQQESNWLTQLSAWLQGIFGGLGKVETINKAMQISAFEQAALHACKVIAWVIGSAALPAVLALYSGNPYWLALTPFINAAGAFLVKWSGIQAAAAAAKQPSAQ